jgi:hypothetical protein
MSMYSHDEEKKIVDYLVENNFIHRIKGDQVWKELEEAKVVNRTWQSLKQHFRKRIIHELHYPRYSLDKQTLALFHDHFNREVKKKKAEAKRPPVATTQAQTVRKVANLLESSSSSDDSDVVALNYN